MNAHVILCDSFYPSFRADLLVAVLVALLGLVTAYLIYILSVRLTRKDRLKYFAALIDKIVPSIDRQAKYCNDHAKAISERPFENNNLQLEANRDPKRLADKVDQEGVYHAFLWKYNRSGKIYKAFQELYGYIDYIDYLVDDLIKTNERILMFTWERKKQYQLLYKKLKEGMQSLVLIEEIKQQQPRLIDYAKVLLEELDKEPQGENLVETFTKVVSPFQKFIIKEGKTHPKVTELLFLTQDLSNEYAGIELSAKHNAEDYRYYAAELTSAAKNLLESSEQLRNDFRT